MVVLPDSTSRVPEILDEVLTIVRTRRGIDFTGYRRSTLRRRIANWLRAVAESDVERYLDRLRTSDGEVEGLIGALTIKVSRFYRNAKLFDALRHGLLPDLMSRFAPERLRAWSAGCGRGEEAYTLAMLLAETKGDIDATDIDTEALTVARAGRYPREAFAEVPQDLMAVIHAPAGAALWSVPPRLCERVRFERHDLSVASGPPADRRYHLVCCRNVLIYFEPSLQARVNRVLIDSLEPGGLLCLGEAEWLVSQTERVAPVDRKLKVFRRR